MTIPRPSNSNYNNKRHEHRVEKNADTVSVRSAYGGGGECNAYVALVELAAELVVERVGHLHVLEHALELRRKLAAALRLRREERRESEHCR